MTVELAVAQTVPDRHARRSAETRDRLLGAARKLFVQLGYHATRPQDIAREADVATGTFYTHFTDKREAFLAFVAQAGDELMQRIGPRSTPIGFKDRLTKSLNALLEYDDENPGVLGAAFTDPAMIDRGSQPVQGLREGLAQSLAQGLERGIEEGHLRSDFDPDLIAQGIVGLIHQALDHGRRSSFDRDDLVHQVTRFCELALVQRSEPTTEAAASQTREDPS
jgi:AcrR family transcriptional regulator